MSNDQKSSILYRGARYLPVPEEDLEFMRMVTAAAPSTEEEWKSYARDLFAVYADHFAAFAPVREIEDELRAMSQKTASLKGYFARAQQSYSLLDLREAAKAIKEVEAAIKSTSMGRIKKLANQLNAGYKLAKQHKKLKKRVESVFKKSAHRF